MKCLIGKELRENLSVGLIALVILSALLILDCRTCTALSTVDRARYDPGFAGMQPILASTLLREAAFFCALFGAILGWLQIYRERHRDLWAFLIHRPVSPTRILVAKMVAGWGVYGIAAGLPLLLLVIWVSVPGHVFAPFEWRMAWPIAGCFLAGGVYYFAGLLTALRQARWYGSRGLGLGMALAVTSATVIFASRGWLVIAAVLIGGCILAASVWGSFLTGGHYRGQPPLAKVALVSTFAIGSFIVTMVVSAFVVDELIGLGDYTASNYQMAKDGTIYRWVHAAGQPVRYEELNGAQPKDPRTGRPLTLEQLGQGLSPAYFIHLDFAEGSPPARRNWNSTGFFQVWQANQREVWYYSVGEGCLVGFDLASRKQIGVLGANGFANQPAAPGTRLRAPPMNIFGQRRTLTTATGVYAVNVEDRSVRPLFRTSPGDPIGGATDVTTSDSWRYTLVATKRSVVLLTPEGETVWKIPREPASQSYTELSFFVLEPTNHFAVWLAPSQAVDQQAGTPQPIHVVWLNAQGGGIRHAELPPLASAQFAPGIQESLLPPILSLSVGRWWLSAHDSYRNFILALPWSVACAGAAWWLGTRYAFSARTKLGWVLFNLACGIPGLLALLAVQEWPARERCPGCHKSRVVDQEHCEHCGAPFTPPLQIGTEIFEPLAAK